jgi:hypothetical protein
VKDGVNQIWRIRQRVCEYVVLRGLEGVDLKRDGIWDGGHRRL